MRRTLPALARAIALVIALAPATLARAQDGAVQRLLVRYRADVGSDRRQALAARLGGRERKSLPRRRLAVVELPSPADAGRALAALRAQPEVEYAAPDVRIQAAIAPDDPGFASQWWLANASDTDIDAPQGWDVLHDASGVVVALVDSGIDLAHEDLAANLWTNPGERLNGRDDDGNGFVDDIHGVDCIAGTGDPTDDNGHGTHVAGTIGAVGDNGLGTSGVAWRTQLMALKVLDSTGGGWYSDAIECIDYAVEMKARGANVRVLNASWGAGNFDPMLQDAFRAANAAGILAVAAAGNDGSNHRARPFYPASFALDGLIAVAATSEAGGLAGFSDYGADVEIAAPGVFILSTLPGNQYGYLSGTSMASPQVAGAAALLAAQNPAASVLDLRARLLATADRVDALKGEVQSGRLNLGAALAGSTAPALASDLPVAGRKLAVVDVAAKPKAKLVFVAKDAAIAPPVPGGPADPTLTGAELVVSNPDSGETVEIPLEAGGWTYAHKAYRYAGASPCRAVLKAGALSAKCAGPSFRFPLEAPAQGRLRVELGLGAARVCSEFGGMDVAKDFGIGFGKSPTKGAFAATAAPAPPTCP